MSFALGLLRCECSPIGILTFLCCLAAATAARTTDRLKYGIWNFVCGFCDSFRLIQWRAPRALHLPPLELIHPQCGDHYRYLCSLPRRIQNGQARTAGQVSLPPLAEHILTFPIKAGGVGLRDSSLSAIPACIVPLLRSIRYATFGIPFRQDPSKHHKLPSIYTQHLMHWKTTPTPNALIRTLRILLPSFHEATIPLSNPNSVPPSLTNTVLSQSLAGLSSRLYQNSVRRRWNALIPTLDDETLGLLPSLLSPTTSIPLHSLPRSYADHRFSAIHYRFLLRLKLRLPIIPHIQQPTTCHHCQHQMDVFGDHLFTCVYSKRNMPTFHNHLRDTLIQIARTLAPLAGIVRSPHDVLCEPTNILPTFPNRRPFDLALRLAKPSTMGIKTVGVDVTRPPTRKPLNRQSSSHLPQITRTHLVSMRFKLEGRSHDNIASQSIIRDINTSQATLLPFTVDHLGGLGPLSIPFLFHPKRSPITHAPPITADMLSLSNDQSLYTFDRAVDSTNLHIADKATQIWKINHPKTPFGNTHHTFTPTQWAMQALSLNISHALANAITTALQEQPTSTTRPPTTFRGPTPYAFLHRQTAYRTAAAPPDATRLASTFIW